MSKLTNYFYENAKKYPNKLAIWCDGKTATYNELSTMITKTSNMLLSLGVRPGDNIGFPMNNSIESVVLFFAAAEIGVAIAPVNPSLPIDNLQKAFAAAEVTCIIARKNFFTSYNHENMISICIDDSKLDGIFFFGNWINFPDTRPQVEADTNQTLILTMTSGSTGEPKPIELSQKNKIDRAFAHIKLYNITNEDRILAATPLYHSLAERLVIMPLLIGATSILLPRFTPNLWLNCIAEQKVTFTIAVSAQLSQISQLLSSPFLPDTDSLRCIVSSSSLLEPHVKKELIEKLDCEVHEIYGTSETSTITNINFKETTKKVSSVGKPINGALIKILDDNFNELKTGEIGEIACKSSLSFKGYYKMASKTEESYCNGYFLTGDLGKLDDDGYLYFIGRKKDLIITGGINVYPNDIEKSLIKLEGIKECAAFSYPDERLGEVVAVAVVIKDNHNVSIKQIRFHCAKYLADFQQPHKIFLLTELPKNALGKVVKMKLYETVRKLGGYNDEYQNN